MEEENRRILEFSKQQQAREEARMAEKKAEEEAKAAVQGELAKKIVWEKQQAEEMERCVCVLSLSLSLPHLTREGKRASKDSVFLHYIT